MDRLTSNIVYRVPIASGPKVRIRVQTYEDGDAASSAAPAQGEFDEPPAINAIMVLAEHALGTRIDFGTTLREYRFTVENPDGRVVRVPDTVIIRGGATRVREMLFVIHRAIVSPPAGLPYDD